MDTRNCPTCDAANPVAARFCTNCGAVLATTSETISLGQNLTTPPAPPAPPVVQPAQLPQPYAQPGQYPPQPYAQPGQYPQQQPYAQPGQYPQQQPYAQPQINVVVNTQATAVAQTAGGAVIVKPKSLLIAFLLTFFFGPFGLFYVTVRGALIFLLVTIVLSIMTAGAFGFLSWIISMVWALIGASNYNKTIVVVR